jgi:hypothetical protein
MMAFDAPNREVCTVARGSTTTPLQALVTLNDTQFVEAARAFAQRILTRDAATELDRLQWAFLEATSRRPDRDEVEVLHRALERERARYTQKPELAHDYLSVGESPISKAIDPVELAAWSQIASLLFNLSETVTRN